MVGRDGGTAGVDDQYAQRSMAGFGAFILGRKPAMPPNTANAVPCQRQ